MAALNSLEKFTRKTTNNLGEDGTSFWGSEGKGRGCSNFAARCQKTGNERGVSVKGGECGNKICELFFSVFTDYRFSICASLRSVFFTIRSCLLLPFDCTPLPKFVLI